MRLHLIIYSIKGIFGLFSGEICGGDTIGGTSWVSRGYYEVALVVTWGTSGIPSVKLEGCSRDVLMAFDLYRVVAEDGCGSMG